MGAERCTMLDFMPTDQPVVINGDYMVLVTYKSSEGWTPMEIALEVNSKGG